MAMFYLLWKVKKKGAMKKVLTPLKYSLDFITTIIEIIYWVQHGQL